MSVDGIIVVAGEALVDLVPRGDGLDAHLGGGAFNTARTVARIGRRVAYLGRLSGDRFGRGLASTLADDGVALDCVVRTTDPTTLALAELDDAGGADYRFYTLGTAAAGLMPEAAISALPSNVDMLHVGTLGLVVEPLALALEAVVERLAGHALVAVDPNVRPATIEDPASYRARLSRVLARSDLVKVSEEDVRWLHPGADPVHAVRRLLVHGPAVGLLTRGPHGAVVVTREVALPVPAPATKVVDTIGAGDAFGGGFLAWWHERGLGRDDLLRIEPVAEATAFACRVAARTCSRAGAAPPYRSEVEVVAT